MFPFRRVREAAARQNQSRVKNLNNDATIISSDESEGDLYCNVMVSPSMVRFSREDYDPHQHLRRAGSNPHHQLFD